MIRHSKALIVCLLSILVFVGGSVLFWRGQLFAASLTMEQQLKPVLATAEKLLSTRQYGRAFDAFVRCGDLARSNHSTLAVTIDARANAFMKSLDKLSQAQLNAIEASLPAWSDLSTAGGRIWIKRFYEQRIRLSREAGNAAEVDRYSGLVHTLCARIIKEHSSELLCRQAVRGYLEFNSANGSKGEEPVLETTTSPVVRFVTLYSEGEDAQTRKDHDAAAAKFAAALADPFAESRDKLVIHYVIAYSYSLLGRTQDALQHCDYILSTFNGDSITANHGAFQLTALFKVILSEQLSFDNARAAATQYAGYISAYPTSKELPNAWLRQGMALERAGAPTEALACFDQVLALYPDSNEGKEIA